MSTDIPAGQHAGQETRRPLRRALISVYDKTGVVDLAAELHRAGVTIVSTGGSAALIEAGGIPVTRVEELTGFPECLDDRVKTLHPMVHAGLLADMTRPSHVQELPELGVEPFDLLISNLYPFADTVASGADWDGCIAQIDIGGPAMVRAAAKNHASLAVITDPAAYPEVRSALVDGGFTLAQRRELAARAFQHTATYDVAVASWMANQLSAPDGARAEAGADPAWLGRTWTRLKSLRYGENPHQAAALFTAPGETEPGLAQAQQLGGKEMSYNNYVDADAAWRAAHDHREQPCCAIVKHNNPCGIAIGAEIAEAHAKAHACDPVSAYGGVIAVNRPVSLAMATTVVDIFTEVLIAPDFEPEALELLATKKYVRLLRCTTPPRGVQEWRHISGGLLVQDADRIDAVIAPTVKDKETAGHGDAPEAWTLVSGSPADDATLSELSFAWRAVRAVKSNAILLAKEGASVGIGMGQVNRVDSAQLAVSRAGSGRARGAVAASDAFFPFADGLQVLIDAGVRAVVAPGGSIRDAEVIEAARAAGVSMYFTGTRHFAH